MEKNKLESQSVEFAYGNKTVKLETHKVARQTTGAVLEPFDVLVGLTTVVARKEADPKKDFFPLAVFYQEKFMLQDLSQVDSSKEKLVQQKEKH